jgi:spermidine/putrescine-binding protein
MRKKILVATFGVAAFTMAAAPAFAASNGFSGRCVGSTTSYTAQGNDISPFVSANGIGNVAAANGVKAADAMNYIKGTVCGT